MHADTEIDWQAYMQQSETFLAVRLHAQSQTHVHVLAFSPAAHITSKLVMPLPSPLPTTLEKKEWKWLPALRQGERDYVNIRGGTGPLVYPAGFLYLFAALRWLTGGGDVAAGQAAFAGLYLATQAVVLGLYVRSRVCVTEEFTPFDLFQPEDVQLQSAGCRGCFTGHDVTCGTSAMAGSRCEKAF